MKKLLLFFAVILTLESRAATVWYALTNFNNTAATNSLKIQRVNDNVVADGSYLVIGVPVTLRTTNGIATNSLATGNYGLWINGTTNKPVYFQVPNDTNTYNVTDLLISGANFFRPSGVLQIVGGNGVSVSPSNGKGILTISAIADLSNATNNDVVVSNAVVNYSKNTVGLGATNNTAAVAAGLTNQINANTIDLTNRLLKTSSVVAAGVDTNAPVLLYNLVTNAVHTRLLSPIVISGSTASGVNGTYVLDVTNTFGGAPQVRWTNTLDNSLRISLNYPGDFAGLAVLEDNSPASVLYFSTPIVGFEFWPDTWEAIDGPPSDVVENTFATNTVVNVYTESTITNGFFYAAGNNQIWVDGGSGNDIVAAASNGKKTPFRTIAPALAAAVSNDVVQVVPGFYADEDTGYIKSGVTLWVYGSTIRAPIIVQGGGTLLGGFFRLAPHYDATNSALTTVTRDVRSEADSGDGIVIDNANGLMQWWNNDFGSYWDACIINSSSTNSVMFFKNTRFWSINRGPPPVQVTWGFHGIGWNLGPAEGGKLILDNVFIENINSTNATFSNPSEPSNANAGIIINPDTIGVTSSGMASIDLNNVTIKYGSTNAGVIVNAISNVLNIPITGSYWDVRTGADASKTNTSTTLRVLGRGANQTPFTQTANSTIANTTTETKLTGTGVGSTVIPANYLTPGKTYRVFAEGYYSTGASSDLTLRLRLGGVAGTVIAHTATIGQDDSRNSEFWSMVVTFTYRGANTVVCSGQSFLHDAGIAEARMVPIQSDTTTTSITASSALEITPTVQWGLADAANTLTCHLLTITEMN